MGVRGPVPKRSGTRLGHISNAEKNGELITKGVAAKRVPVPAKDPDWHPLAQRWYDSLKKSGQSQFYEPSDWAMAYSLADDLSYYKRSTKRSGQMLATIYSTMSTLLVTEGDRRRAAVELHRDEPEEVSYADQAMDKYSKMMQAAQQSG